LSLKQIVDTGFQLKYTNQFLELHMSNTANTTRNLLVEYTQNPISLDTKTPRFFWECPLRGRGRKQSAYRLLVASSKELLNPDQADCWDSGKVESSKSSHVEYAGTELCSNRDYYWTVQIWCDQGEAQGYCDSQSFGTALFEKKDWKAKWIGMGASEEPKLDPYSISQQDASAGLQLSDDDFKKMQPEFKDFNPELRSPQLRKSFSLSEPIKRARVYVCGLGLFQLSLNGHKVGDEVISTPRTDFDKRVYYFTYDLTEKLNAGDNTLGILLGGGWYNAQKKFWHWQAPWFGSPCTLLQLEIEYQSGKTEKVISDETWRGDWSPISLSCIYDGEDYDAQLEQAGWDAPEFDDSQWQKVNLVQTPEGKLTAIDHQANKVMDRWQPISMSEPEPGVYVFDMGKVMTGWTQLRIPRGVKGKTVTLKYSELLFDNGMIAQRRSCGKARQAEFYTMKGTENEVYEPHLPITVFAMLN